ncbi:hypothetical protein LMG23992_01225 [Cupriavidus laharis]|uniref:Uncharacterized protein n=1 Tax=Cupriavidus laharis TaxID=151654 RepID=A0ABN7Y5L2_9BURK|nr:hypothetical protein LMG23992_01225 [Cupriavidus laharis]
MPECKLRMPARLHKLKFSQYRGEAPGAHLREFTESTAM